MHTTERRDAQLRRVATFAVRWLGIYIGVFLGSVAIACDTLIGVLIRIRILILILISAGCLLTAARDVLVPGSTRRLGGYSLLVELDALFVDALLLNLQLLLHVV